MGTDVRDKAMKYFNLITEYQLRMSESRLHFEQNVASAKAKVKETSDDVCRLARATEKLCLSAIESAAAKRRRDIEDVNIKVVREVVPKLVEAVVDESKWVDNLADTVDNLVGLCNPADIANTVVPKPGEKLVSFLDTDAADIMSVEPTISAKNFCLSVDSANVSKLELTISVDNIAWPKISLSPFYLSDFVVKISTFDENGFSRNLFDPVDLKALPGTGYLDKVNTRLINACVDLAVDKEAVAMEVSVKMLGHSISNSPHLVRLQPSKWNSLHPMSDGAANTTRSGKNTKDLDKSDLKAMGYLNVTGMATVTEKNDSGQFANVEEVEDNSERNNNVQGKSASDLDRNMESLKQQREVNGQMGGDFRHVDLNYIKTLYLGTDSTGKDPLPSSVSRDVGQDKTYVSDVCLNVVHVVEKWEYKGTWPGSVQFNVPRYVLCVPPRGSNAGRKDDFGQDVLVLDEACLHHFDCTGNELHPSRRIFDGRGRLYRGLAYHEASGLVLTLRKDSDGIWLNFVDATEAFSVVRKIHMTQTCFLDANLKASMCRYLTATKDRVYATDFGLGWLFEVDLDNNLTYYRCSDRKLATAMGVFVDKAGNVVVASSENEVDSTDGKAIPKGQLLVLGPTGTFIRSLDVDCQRPIGLCYDGKHVFITDSYSRTVKAFEVVKQR